MSVALFDSLQDTQRHIQLQSFFNMLSMKSMLPLFLIAQAVTANVAVYWGQNGDGGQGRLSEYCSGTAADTVILSFVTRFPNLEINFSNQCGATFPSGLLHCSQIGEDIKTCQAQGKKVLLSLGGAVGNYGFTSVGEAEDFAGTLWNKFGAGSDEERPFDDAIVDGFDFDLENNKNGVKPVGYPQLANKLRSFFTTDASKSYYLSAAPECAQADLGVQDILDNVALDFVFVQFYNNPCSLDKNFNWQQWSDYAKSAPNKNVKIYIGLPASKTVDGYVDLATIKKDLKIFQCDPAFGGFSVWDASGAWNNVQDGVNFAQGLKAIDQDRSICAPKTTSSTIATTSSTKEPVRTTTGPALTSSYANSSAVDAISTYTDLKTTVITVTSCQDNKCTAVPVTTGLTTVTIDNTVYTTYCPLTTVTDLKTTVITITSCDDNKCTEVPVTTGLTTVTQDNTVYTTYCPVTSSAPAQVPTTVAPYPTTAAQSGESTVYTVVTSTVSAAKSSPVAPVWNNTNNTVSTYENVAATTANAGFLVALIGAALLMI